MAKVKEEICEGLANAGKQLLKNAGKFSLRAQKVAGELQLFLKISKAGDCWKEPQLSFLAPAALLDPAQLSHTCLKVAYNTKLIQAQIKVYLAVRHGDSINADSHTPPVWWERNREIYPDLAPFAIRVLKVVPGSADVERSVNSLNQVVVPKRTQLKDKKVRAYTTLYANSNKRKARNDVRREQQYQKFKERRRNQEYTPQGSTWIPSMLNGSF